MLRTPRRRAIARRTPLKRGKVALRRRPLATPASPFAALSPATLERAIGGWAAELAARGFRSATCTLYERTVRMLARERTLQRARSAGQILVRIAKRSPATRAAYLAAVKSFDEWAAANGVTRRRAFADRVSVKLDVRLPRPLTARQLAQLGAA